MALLGREAHLLPSASFGVGGSLCEPVPRTESLSPGLLEDGQSGLQHLPVQPVSEALLTSIGNMPSSEPSCTELGWTAVCRLANLRLPAF